MIDQLEVDTLVVGAGPVGLTAALLLEQLGLSVKIVERRECPQQAPAAHVVNARTFEIWRQIGLDVDRIRSAAQDPADAGWVHWVTKLGGQVLGTLPFEHQEATMLSITPTPLRNLSQHRLEPLLVNELEQLGRAVSYGHCWTGSQQNSDGMVSTIDGPAGSYRVRSRWLLACDGASSPVRNSTGIELVGQNHLQSVVMIHLAADLRASVQEAPGVLYWVCDPASGGAFVAHDIDSEWVYMYPYDPRVDSPINFTKSRCEKLVRAALEDARVEFEILTVSPWTMTAQVADRYREGGIFLVGDAAHRFPPTGGLGLNTGVQDAHNLAWKLAAVVRGTAPPALLESYETERRPVAQRNASVSLENALKLQEVAAALGDDVDPVRSRANFNEVLGSEEGRATVASAIANQATHFDMLGLQLGYRYKVGGMEETDSVVASEGIRSYRPSGRPGSRLPHAWIRRNGVTCSTLDLVPLDRPVIIAGPACGLDGAYLRVGVDLQGAEEWWRLLVGLPDDGALLVRPDQHIAAHALAAGQDAWSGVISAIKTHFEPSLGPTSARRQGWPANK